MARAGEDLELHYTAKFRTHPPSQAAGTVYFAMDVDDVLAALGSRPDRLSEVWTAGAGAVAHRAADRRSSPFAVSRRSCAADGETVAEPRAVL